MNEISDVRASIADAGHSGGGGQIAEALVGAISKLRNPPRNRSVEVSTRGGGKYAFRYATLDKILDMARPVLAAEGLVLMQPISTNEKGGLVLVTRLLHRSGESLETSVPLPAPGSDPQSFGSAVTYLRRYAVTALLGIASDEDDDANRAAGNQVRDTTPRSDRLRDEADRATSPASKLAALAKAARAVDDGAALIRGWNAAARDVAEDKRDDLLKLVGVGVRNSLGQVPASAFVRAARMEGRDGLEAFDAVWGGEWLDTLLAMQKEAPDAYKALTDHVSAQTRRVTGQDASRARQPVAAGAK